MIWIAIILILLGIAIIVFSDPYDSIGAFVIIIGITFLTTSYFTSSGTSITIELERAYFEGQKDALTNDIRIKRNADSCWVWSKSPWDSGSTPEFNPNVICY